MGEPIEYDEADPDITDAACERIAEAHEDMRLTIHAGDQLRILDLDTVAEEGIDLRGWQ